MAFHVTYFAPVGASIAAATFHVGFGFLSDCYAQGDFKIAQAKPKSLERAS
jgi:hypothetical protein